MFLVAKFISSIWNKIKKKQVEFDDVYDKFAIRVILDSPSDKEKEDCWRANSIVTDKYSPQPNRMRDWISHPKGNGYELLHTTVMALADNGLKCRFALSAWMKWPKKAWQHIINTKENKFKTANSAEEAIEKSVDAGA